MTTRHPLDHDDPEDVAAQLAAADTLPLEGPGVEERKPPPFPVPIVIGKEICLKCGTHVQPLVPVVYDHQQTIGSIFPFQWTATLRARVSAIEAACRNFTIRNTLNTIRGASIHFQSLDSVTCTLVVGMMNRDGPATFNNTVRLFVARSTWFHDDDAADEVVARAVRDAYLFFVEHEVDESIVHVEKNRWFEPHPKDPTP